LNRNFLFFFEKLLSILYIIGGIWLLDQRSSIETNLEEVWNITTDLSGLSIAVGIIGIVISTIGIAATIRENIFFLRIVI
jgi:hypothetical protein